MTAVICCIAKCEERYLEEWIKYNIALGFSKIYIYDNSDDGKALSYLSSNPSLVVIPFPGKARQMEAYSQLLNQYKKTHTWCAFIDCDEFIVLRKHPNIVAFLQEHCPYGAVGLNWYMFGSNGELEYRDQPVTQRFTRRQKNLDPCIKSIVRLEHCSHIINPHFGFMIGRIPTRDTHGNVIKGSFNPKGTDNIACIHHYFTKSKGEFKEKVDRGRADIVEKRNFEQEFALHDLNEVEDLSAWEFYRKLT